MHYKHLGQRATQLQPATPAHEGMHRHNGQTLMLVWSDRDKTYVPYYNVTIKVKQRKLH